MENVPGYLSARRIDAPQNATKRGAMNSSDWIAIGALVVAGVALALELRRWFEAGPRLRLSLIADAVEFPEGDGKPKLAINVTNRGSMATTVTHVVAFAYGGPFRWRRFLPRPFPRRWKKAYLAGIVGSAVVPYEIGPNKYMLFQMKYSDETTSARKKGDLFVGVYCTHSSGAFLVRVPREKTTRPTADAEKPKPK